MSFSDEDLKRLKELDSTASIHDKYGNEEVRELVHRLIARLEAAESLIEFVNRYTKHTKMPDTAKDLYEAWRKSAGEVRAVDGKRYGKSFEMFNVFMENCLKGKTAIVHAPEYVVMSRGLYEKKESKLSRYREALENIKEHTLTDDVEGPELRKQNENNYRWAKQALLDAHEGEEGV